MPFEKGRGQSIWNEIALSRGSKKSSRSFFAPRIYYPLSPPKYYPRPLVADIPKDYLNMDPRFPMTSCTDIPSRWTIHNPARLAPNLLEQDSRGCTRAFA